MKMWNLEGKKAVVTGGTKGIGNGIVKEFLHLGADVLFTARKEQEVVAVEQELRDQGFDVHGIVADVTSSDHRFKVFNWIQQHWGKLDILVNNAGINLRKATNDYSPSEFFQVMDTNLIAPFELCRSLFPLLQQSSQAAIINIGSVAGSFDMQTGAPYGMSKSGLIQLSRSLANEWAANNIRVNTVSPWFTDTPLIKGVVADPVKMEKITSSTPLRRIAQDEEMAAAVAFLAMDKASFITGQNLTVDGGATIRLL